MRKFAFALILICACFLSFFTNQAFALTLIHDLPYQRSNGVTYTDVIATRDSAHTYYAYYDIPYNGSIPDIARYGFDWGISFGCNAPTCTSPGYHLYMITCDQNNNNCADGYDTGTNTEVVGSAVGQPTCWDNDHVALSRGFVWYHDYVGLCGVGDITAGSLYGLAPPIAWYLTTQVRPTDPVIPPEISGSGRKAVILTHGWNSRVEAWAVGMADQICVGVGGTAPTTDPASGYGNKLTLRCHTADWDIFVYDWSAMADTKAPWSAWANAVERGTSLGRKLASKNYAHVHLLAHSAGSMVIDSAKNWLRGLPQKPFIHLTFFDAYDPFAQIKKGVLLSSYGEGADWVDNYVDKRPLDALFGTKDMDGTQLLLPSAYNVDVTKWDVRPAPGDAYDKALFRHAWPNVFYADSTFTPMVYDLGYQLSLEVGNGKPFPVLPQSEMDF